MEHPVTKALGVLRLGLLAMFTGGCATSLSGSAGPTYETTGHAGGEARVEGSAAVGSSDFHLFAALASGGGYLGSSRAGYGLIEPALGFESGQAWQFTAEGLYALRLLHGTESVGRSSSGAAFQLLARVADLGAENSALRIGPRLSAEYLWGADQEPDRGLLALSIVIRWVTFDTTANSWFGH